MPKELRFGDDVRKKMIAGVNALAKADQLANGPRGRNIVLEKSYGAPTVTKDGIFGVRSRFVPLEASERSVDTVAYSAPK